MNGSRVKTPKSGPDVFRPKELFGSLFDLWFLLPLVGLMVSAERGGNALLLGRDLIFMSGAWLLSSLLFRTPLPLQPLKVWAFLFLILRPTPTVASFSAVLLGLLLVLAAKSGLPEKVEGRLSPASFERIRRGVRIYVQSVAFLAIGTLILRHLPDGLALFSVFGHVPGMGGHPHGVLAVLLLVLPQVPVTLLNGILSTVHERRESLGGFPDARACLSGNRLTLWVGLADLSAGLLGVLPFCHGSGNLWVYRRYGIKSLLPSCVSSLLLIGLGSALLGGHLPLPSPVFFGAFLAGFFIAERILKREGERPSCSGHRAKGSASLELWVLSGGVISGTIVMGGLPLLLPLLLGIQTATTFSGAGKQAGVFQAIGHDAPHFCLEKPRNCPETFAAACQSIAKNMEAEICRPCHFSGRMGFSGHSVAASIDSALPPSRERFFRRAREYPGALLACILLIVFRVSLPSRSPSRPVSDPPSVQTTIHSLYPPMRAP